MSQRTEKILSGKSKATKLNDYEVLDIAKQKAQLNHKVESRNYSYENNILKHNGSIEYIIRKDGLVIKNSQERQFSGSMFGAHVSCPSGYNIPEHISLPIETIFRDILKERFFDSDQGIHELIDKIEIIDSGKNDSNEWYYENTGTVIKVENNYYWHKRDERNFYLILLPKPVTTIKEAEDSLKPNLVKNLKPDEYVRQGDFYFIPVTNEFKEYDKLHYRLGEYNIQENYGNMQQIAHIKTQLLTYFADRFKDPDSVEWSHVISDLLNRENYYINEYFAHNYIKLQQLKEILEYIKYHLDPRKEKGELVRYEIFDSNHKADNSYYDGINQFVKGFIYHNNKDHIRIKLEDWHLVLKNESVLSYEVNANGRGGFD